MENSERSFMVSHPSNRGSNSTLLMTCMVLVEVGGCRQKARVFLDSRSTISFMTNRLVASLKAKKMSLVTEISGIENVSAPSSRHKVELTLRSIYNSASSFHISVNTITGELPDRALLNLKRAPPRS